MCKLVTPVGWEIELATKWANRERPALAGKRADQKAAR